MIQDHWPPLGLGCAPLANLYQPIPEAQAIELIQFALENGVTLFDTAPLYGAGVSEHRVGSALRGVPRDRFTLSTKVGRLVLPDGSMQFDWSRDGVRRSIAESLERLKQDRVDIVHLHDPDQDYAQALNEAFPALAELRAQGVIGAIGAGMNQWQMCLDFARHADFDCFLLAGRYTLLEQTSLPLLEECARRNIRIMLGGVYNSGILATGSVPGAKYNYADAPVEIMERTRRIEAVCAQQGVLLRAAALRYPLLHPAVSTLVIGAQSKDEFAQTLASFNTEVPEPLWAALREESLIV